MSEKIYLTHDDIHERAVRLHELLMVSAPKGIQVLRCYPIPRGGIPAAYALMGVTSLPIEITHDPELADFFVDDIIDTGETMRRYCDEYPGKMFLALVDDTEKEPGTWYVFPWEVGEDGNAETAEANVVRMLQVIGEDPTRGGLLETPRRVVKAWAHWTSGYNKNPADVLKTFEDGAEHYDEMVVVKDIPFFSHCEHHMAPFFGVATIAYIPNRKIVGLSKLSRLLDIFARRLQVQERLTHQVAAALMEHLDPKGVGVVLRARHMCMESRGVSQQGHHTITSALLGVMRDEEKTRAEFLDLANSGTKV